MINAQSHRLPILIVGGGPVGLFLAHALSQLEVPSILLERHNTRLGAPKAHALSPRSLEICRQFDISVSEIRRYPAPREEASHVRFVTTLAGEEIGSLPYERMSLDVLDASPEMLHNIAQPDFEAILEKRIRGHPLVDFRRGWTWRSSEEDESTHSVIATVENTYTKENHQIRSSLIVACDGAGSAVRESLAISMDAEHSVETMMTIHFAADLRAVVGDMTGMLYWIMDPAARGFIIAYDLGRNQVLIHNYDPTTDPVESFDKEKCRNIVMAAIGREVPLKVHSHMPWNLRRQVANEFYKGRHVLAGDAAHAFPPTGGLGLNSGIGDAHCLAYKIALFYRDIGTLPRLLDQYQAERRPIADRNSKQSVKNGKAIFSLLRALKNTDPDVNKARRDMETALTDPSNRALVTKGIIEQTEHFDNLMLHIGYVYDQSWSPANATDFHPTYGPGARLAHAWIAIPPSSHLIKSLPGEVDLSYLHDLHPEAQATKRYSTLDLVDKDRFTLIVGDGHHVKTSDSLDDLCRQRGIGFSSVQYGRDFTMAEKKGGRVWLNGFRLEEGYAVLVRPDQHTACLIAPCKSITETSDVVKALLDSAGCEM